jgi:hypothetical protein
MHRVTDRVKGFYAKTKKPARLNLSREPISELRTVYLYSGLRAGQAQGLKCLRGMQNNKS